MLCLNLQERLDLGLRVFGVFNGVTDHSLVDEDFVVVSARHDHVTEEVDLFIVLKVAQTIRLVPSLSQSQQM